MTEQELKLAKALERKGFTVLKTGWPDFLVIDKNSNRGFALEVKQPNEELKEHQKNMHQWLCLLGLPVHTGRSVEDVESLRGRFMLTSSTIRHFQKRIDILQSAIEERVNFFIKELEQLTNEINAASIYFDIPENDKGINYTQPINMLKDKNV